MDTRKKSNCAILGCLNQFNVKRHYFKFPKEQDRWLKWVDACKRYDLLSKGPQYSFNNIRLCHLHFEEKLFRINKVRASLHPDAVPTLLLGRDTKQQDNTNVIAKQNVATEKEELSSNTYAEEAVKVEEENSITYAEGAIKVEEENRNTKTSKIILPTCHSAASNFETEVMKPDTSAEEPGTSLMTTHTKRSLDDSFRIKKLHEQVKRLKTQNNALRTQIRRLHAKERERKSVSPSRQDEYNNLRELGRKLLPEDFNGLLTAQIDAQCKSKHGKRYMFVTDIFVYIGIKYI